MPNKTGNQTHCNVEV